jgi:type II secretory pathway component PulJ
MMKKLFSNSRSRKRTRGQSTIEYLLMVAFGAVFALQIAKFFNDVFQDGMSGLEKNVQNEMQTGKGFTK